MPRVLIVDDSTAILEVLEMLLSDEGYDVVCCADPYEAIRLAEQQPIDLLLTDIVMPDLSGTAVAERIRTIHPDLPVILMSGYHDVTRLGYPLVTKPFQLARLSQMLRCMLDQKPSQPRE